MMTFVSVRRENNAMQQELSPARRIAINVLIMLAVFAVAVILAVTLTVCMG
jgi:hypothetical protein